MSFLLISDIFLAAFITRVRRNAVSLVVRDKGSPRLTRCDIHSLP